MQTKNSENGKWESNYLALPITKPPVPVIGRNLTAFFFLGMKLPSELNLKIRSALSMHLLSYLIERDCCLNTCLVSDRTQRPSKVLQPIRISDDAPNIHFASFEVMNSAW